MSGAKPPWTFGDVIPDRVSSPYDSIEDWMEERGQSIADLADAMDWPVSAVSEILSKRPQITTDLACALGRAIGPNAEFWLRRDGIYQAWLTRSEA